MDEEQKRNLARKYNEVFKFLADGITQENVLSVLKAAEEQLDGIYTEFKDDKESEKIKDLNAVLKSNNLGLGALRKAITNKALRSNVDKLDFLRSIKEEGARTFYALFKDKAGKALFMED